METTKRVVGEFRRSINPPYGINDLPSLLGLTVFFALVLLVAVLMGQPREPESFASVGEQSVGKEEFVSNEVLVRLKESSSDKIKKDAAPESIGIKSIEKINKKLKVDEFEQVLPEKAGKKEENQVFDWYKVELPGKAKKIKGDFDEETSKIESTHPDAPKLQVAINEFKDDPNVEVVEPNFVVKTLAIPNDPYYSSSGSWGQSYQDLYGMHKIDVATAWDHTTGSNSIIVADIDTGVDRNHEDIKNNMWVNTKETPNNGVDDDKNGYIDDYYGWDWYNNDNDPMDDHGHGTHTVGTIAGVGNNAKGVVGVNWTSKIMALKFLSSGGSGYLSDGIAALRYAADMGAKVSSNSWGCSCNSTAMDDAVKYEHDKGMVMVAAAGNNNGDTIDHSPSSADRAIAVAATDYRDYKASFSNWGEKLDVAAPGVNTLSLKAAVSPMCSGSKTVGTRYCKVSGTSMATPHVAGLAALLWAKKPSLTNEEIRQILRHGADDLGAAGKDRNFGYGRINAAGSMNLTSTRPLAPIITSLRSRAIISGTSLQISGSVPGPNFANYKIETGLGRTPSSWTTLATSTSQVINGVLATVDTTQINDGKYIFRITTTATNGKKYQFQVHDVEVDNDRDTQPPTVTITAPSNGATISGYVNIVASAADNEGVSKVYFYVDNVLRRIDTVTPYTYYWNSSSVSNGSHSLVAKAYDAAGNIGTSPTVTVNVSNDEIPPTVNITAPSNGATVSGYVNITASATDSIGVRYVYFYIDGVWKRTDSSAPYAYYWNSSQVSNGSHNIYARAVDTSNNVGTSPTITVNVSNVPDTTPPSVPTGLKARLVTSSRIDLTWNASTDNIGVTGYRLYRNGKLIKITAARGFSDRSVRAGSTYYYRVAAFDAAGNQSAKSASVKIGIPVGTPVLKLGDLNADTKINIRDLSILLSRWATTNATADLDKNGKVNIRDLSILLSRWGR